MNVWTKLRSCGAKRILFATPPLLVIFFALPVFAAPPSANFFIDPANNAAGQNQITADLRYTSLHAYFYVEQGYWSSLSSADQNSLVSKITQVGSEFDDHAYATLRATYGAEWVPGIDNDSRLYILLTQMQGTLGGYIRQNDEQTKTISPSSNEHEMVYLNAQNFLASPNAQAYLAHEFTHVISYNQRERLRGISEETWLAEALAEYAPTVLGYDNPWDGSILAQRAQDFEHLPFDSLLEWKGTDADSASASMFMHYLAARFGENILLPIMHSAHPGIAAIEEALTSTNVKENFNDVFRDWIVANYVNGSMGNDTMTYQYQNLELGYEHLHVSPLFTASIFAQGVSPFNVSVKSWEGRWYRFVPSQLGNNGNNVAKVEFQANDPSIHFVVPIVTSDITGKRSVQFMSIENGYGVLYVPSFGSINLSIAVAPINESARVASNDLTYSSLSLKISLVADIPTGGGSQFTRSDGTLVRAQGDMKVYVVTHNVKRWIQSSEIMNMYGNLLGWDKIVGITPQERDFYPESFLIRAAGDYKVYEVSTNGTKQWLNMTAAQFTASGRMWDRIFTTNDREFAWFR